MQPGALRTLHRRGIRPRRRPLGLLILLVGLICLALPALAQPAGSPQPPAATEGVLDLRGWDFTRNGPLPLTGDWLFWKGRLVDPAALKDGAEPPPDGVLRVPGRWPAQQLDGRPLPHTGVGTYRLRVLLPEDAPPLALRQFQRFVAWKVHVNGAPTLHAGRVGTTAETTGTAGQRAIAAVAPRGQVLDVLVQVAAFGGYGGLSPPLLLGPADTLFGDWQWELAWRSAFLALCVAIGALYLILYGLRPADRVCLAFAITSLAIAAVQLTANTPLGLVLAGDLPGQWLGLVSNLLFPAVWLSCLATALLLFPGTLALRWTLPAMALTVAVPLASLWTAELPGLLKWTAVAALLAMMGVLAVIALRAILRRLLLALPMACAWLVLGLANLALVLRLGFPGVVEAGYTLMLLVQAVLLFDRLRRLLDMANDANDRLSVLNRDLEQEVEERTQHLSDALATLKTAQARLVEQEKLAALGALVAGVAHEVNTPVGVTLTTATHLLEEVEGTSRAFEEGRLGRRAFADFLAQAREAASLLTANAHRIAAVVRSFKQIAADEASGERRRFDLADYMATVAQSLSGRLRRHHRLDMDIPPDLLMDSFPGALAQVMEQLVGNSVDHGFDPLTPGHITLSARPLADGMVELVYADDGRGMPAELRGRVFQPFVTTGRAEGRTGLGLHRVHNLVVAQLGGRIRLDPPGGRGGAADGVRFTITLPRTAPEPEAPAEIQEEPLPDIA